jgi:hypothetical protein
MSYLGIDTAARLSAAQAKILHDNGVSFAGRYLTNPTMSKSLQANEAKNLLDNGVAILLIYETTANRARDGSAAGRTDGATAASIAKQYGIPTSCAIYFAVDYNAPKSDYQLIEQYLCAAKDAISPYKVGVYGKADVINSVKADCYMQCIAWSEGVISPKLNVYQYEWQGGPNAKVIGQKIGVYVDLNRCDDLERAGMWLPKKEEHWYDSAMEWAEEKGLIMDGRPNDPVTRAELATVLKRYTEL